MRPSRVAPKPSDAFLANFTVIGNGTDEAAAYNKQPIAFDGNTVVRERLEYQRVPFLTQAQPGTTVKAESFSKGFGDDQATGTVDGCDVCHLEMVNGITKCVKYCEQRALLRRAEELGPLVRRRTDPVANLGVVASPVLGNRGSAH
jgi:hypothetical protein